MLVVEHPRRAELLTLFGLVLAPSAGMTQAQEPTLVRLSDTVGDTIDLAERDHARLISSAAVNEGTNWRIGCAVGAAVPGAILGIWAGYMYALLHNRVTGWIENDPKGLTMLPGAFTGLCIAVEVVTIGYQMGRAIDRSKALKAEAKRLALGR